MTKSTLPEAKTAVKKRRGRPRGCNPATFAKGLVHLRQYFEREKTAYVPIMHEEPSEIADDGIYRLGYWVANIRGKYRRGEMSAEEIAALEAFDGWRWGIRDELWERRIQLLKQYRERTGLAHVPSKHVEDGFALGAWVARQRTRNGKGKLPAEKAKEFCALVNCAANWRRTCESKSWNAKLQSLIRFSQAHGHTRVPRKFVDNGHSIGTWVNSMRSLYNKGQLSQMRIERLESVPHWNWAVPRGKSFEDGMTALQEYVKAKGVATVPRNFVTEDGYRLGEWVHRQRARRKLKSLSPHQAQQLESLPGWVWEQRKRKAADTIK